MAQRTAHRRHQAIDTYLAADKVEDLCRQRVCSKSWLSTWRNRYDATKATWARERSTRPKSHPTPTPEHVAQAVVSLPLPLRHNGTGSVAAIIQALAQHGREPGPSRRTIDRMVHRHHQEGKYWRANASMVVLPLGTGFLLQQNLSTLDVCGSSPEPAPSLENVERFTDVCLGRYEGTERLLGRSNQTDGLLHSPWT